MIVNKLQTLREEFHRLCNDVSAGSSSENASKVDFGSLDADVGPVDALGLWGCRAGVARYLVQACGFPANFAERHHMLTEGPRTNDNLSLSEGLYVWRLPTSGMVRRKLNVPSSEVIEPYLLTSSHQLLLYLYKYCPTRSPSLHPSPPLELNYVYQCQAGESCQALAFCALCLAWKVHFPSSVTVRHRFNCLRFLLFF